MDAYKLLKDDNIQGRPIIRNTSQETLNSNNSDYIENINNHNDTETSTDSKTIYSIVLSLLFLFSSLFFIKYYLFHNNYKSGISLINYYHGFLTIIITLFYIKKGNIDLSVESNFKKEHFNQIMLRGFCENIFYLCLLLSIRYLNILTFISLLCVLLLMKVIINLELQLFTQKNVFFLGGCIVSVLFLFYDSNYGKHSRSIQNWYGLVYFVLTIFFYNLINKVQEPFDDSTSKYIYFLSTGFVQIVSVPFCISLFGDDTRIDYLSMIILFFVGISGYFTREYIYFLIKKKRILLDTLYMQYIHYLAVVLIIIPLLTSSLFHEHLNFYNIIGGLGIIAVYICKYHFKL